MPKVFNFEQGSVSWFEARLGKPTASEFHRIMDTGFNYRKGEMPYTFLCEKVAEKWRGEPLPGFAGSWETDQGKIREVADARPWYELEYDCDVQQVGFIETDDGRCGCSPDGLIGDEGGIEIKCPEPIAHTKYLLSGELPSAYIQQVHGSLFVTGRKWWKFLSYRREFPPLLITIERDEQIMAKIAESLTRFYGFFDEAIKQLEVL